MNVRTGTVRRFVGDGSMAAMLVEDASGNRAAFLVEERAASGLVADHGVPLAAAVDMAALIGKRVEFVESNAGLVVQVAVVGDEATREESDG